MPKSKSPFDQLENAPSRKKYIKYFEKKRWKGGTPISPYDPSAKRFNVKTETILRHTKLPLRKWYLALCLFSAKKSVSSYELAESLVKLGNEVQIDETLIGGSNSNRHKNKKIPHCQGRSAVDKTLVFGMVEQNSYLITQKVPDAKMKTLVPIIRDNVERVNHGKGEYVIKDDQGNKITTNSIESV
ncbi:2420_t:CDS:2 [Scutellospora calospora]|uniref:2420_t:CDS:1 n=1 Tax=Scutellospora calospora TaxID=85575 RepID=A0ACA9N9D7_9GLOM|nr:2420_t:CDS:2 [Scutellospora calospora]